MKIKKLIIYGPLVTTTLVLGCTLGMGYGMLNNMKAFDDAGIVYNEGSYKKGLLIGAEVTLESSFVCYLAASAYKGHKNKNDDEQLEKEKVKHR